MADTGLTVVPAYRVVAHFVKQAREMEEEAGLAFLERQLRQYLRNTLSGLTGGYAEVGERWAINQLGDPNMDALGQALQEADELRPKLVVEDALSRAAALLPPNGLSARVLLLPGDGESRQLVREMNGVLGVTLASQATLLFFWPTGQWADWLVYTATHEYGHLVRNRLLPRGISGGKAVYLKTEEPETLLDAMVAEGLCDGLARQVFPDTEPPWLHALDGLEDSVWPRVRRRLRVTDPSEIRRFIFGDGDRVPQWTGYCLGYHIVQSYLERHPRTHPASLIGLPARGIFAGSDYATRL